VGDKGESKYAPLLEDPDVRRWLSNLARGSAITSEVALRRVSRASEILGSSPAEMLRAARSNMKTFQDSLEDLVAQLMGEGKSRGYVVGIVKAVKNWLRYNDITLTRRIKIGNVDSTPTIENEQIPTQEELSRILRTSPPRIRVAEALMAFADLRPETIGNYDGSDGLTIGDLPELKIKDGQVVFEKSPAMGVRALHASVRQLHVLRSAGLRQLRLRSHPRPESLIPDRLRADASLDLSKPSE
jgi:hypothetical protein